MALPYEEAANRAKTMSIETGFDRGSFANCPEGAEELSPGFQPCEPSHQAVRPEGARAHYMLDACFLVFNLAPFSGRMVVVWRFPGVETPG
jgi:hypothetical protein